MIESSYGATHAEAQMYSSSRIDAVEATPIPYLGYTVPLIGVKLSRFFAGGVPLKLVCRAGFEVFTKTDAAVRLRLNSAYGTGYRTRRKGPRPRMTVRCLVVL